MMAGEVRTAIGMMSGTSMDGVDVALIRSDGRARVETGPSATTSYVDVLREALKGALGRTEAPADLVAALTAAHIGALVHFLDNNNLDPADVMVVGMHGQTLFHDPDNGVTVQIGDGQQLADACGIPVVNDFRSADVAAGGQGAPFAPLYHAALGVSLDKPIAVVNIGGVANVTWIGADLDLTDATLADGAILAFDTGPGNALIDDWTHRTTGATHDFNGRLARSGSVDEDVVRSLLNNAYFQSKPPKSLDRNAFDLDACAQLEPADGAATLVAFTAAAIARAAEHFPAPAARWLVTGGGRRNPTIMAALEEALRAPVAAVEAVGWDGDALEAQAFAWLALRSLDGLPLSVPSTTGVAAAMSGGVLNRPAGARAAAP